MHQHPRTIIMATVVAITATGFLWAMTAAGPIVPAIGIPAFGLLARYAIRSARADDRTARS